MKIEVTQDIAKKAASTIVQAIDELKKTQKKIIIGVCGGRSAAAVFDELQSHSIEWNNIHIFLIDERKVPITSELRNDLLVRKHLKPVHIHQYQTTDQYNLELHKQGGYFDIVFASMGEDGHVASLFPNHESIKNEELFYIDVSNSPKPPDERISASRKLLLHAKHAILVVSGEAKKEAYTTFLQKKDVIQIPAILFHYIPNSTIITDLEVTNE